jgi:hypothetical protein
MCSSSQLFERYGSEKLEIIELEECSDDDRYIRERWNIENIPCVNIKMPFRTKEERLELSRELARKHHYANPEKHRECASKWNEANPEKHKQHTRKYRENNPEMVRESSLKYREAHREENAERSRKWREDNPEKYKEQNKRRIERQRLKRLAEKSNHST